VLEWLYEWLQAALQWVLDALLWVPREVWRLLLEGLAAVINAIPVPPFLSGLADAWGAIGGPILYFVEISQFAVGFPMVLTAYLIRFLLRRVPFIG
jgi:hypothetical protein